MDVLRFIITEVGRKGSEKKTVNNLPVVDILDYPEDRVDECMKGYDNNSPVLYLFFKRGAFHLAEVSADNCTIHLQASTTTNAIIGYIGVYYVFNLAYVADQDSLMNFLEYAFLGINDFPERMSVGFNKMKTRFDTALEEVKEAKKYKKHALG